MVAVKGIAFAERAFEDDHRSTQVNSTPTTAQVHRLLRERPRPLLNPDLKLIVYWSPRSACTSVYLWFSAISGFASDVARCHSPHQHRTQVYCRSDAYRRAVSEVNSEYRALRVLRDPYTRAVSIYRHALRTGFAEPDLASFSKGRWSTEGGISFQNFLDLLESLDFSTCNTHYRPQRGLYEQHHKPDHVINISNTDLFAGLGEFARTNNLPIANFAELESFLQRERRRIAKTAEIAGTALDHTPFSRAAAAGREPFPRYEQLLTPDARARLRKVYDADFETYGKYL